jgi:hypothetical protein
MNTLTHTTKKRKQIEQKTICVPLQTTELHFLKKYGLITCTFRKQAFKCLMTKKFGT